MIKFAQQLQEMAKATVKAAVEKMSKENIEAFNNLVATEEFKEVKSYFESTDNLVNIIKEDKPQAFEIILEKLNRQASIQTFKNDEISMTIYNDNNTGYVVLVKSNNEPYAIFWNA